MSDDGAGIRIVQELSEINWPRGVAIMEVGTAPWACLDEISRTFFLLAVDVITAGRKPGTLYRIDSVGDGIDSVGDGIDNSGRTEDKDKATSVLSQTNFTDFPSTCSHGFSLPDIVTLARGLTGLPEKFIIFGIEPENISPGTDLSGTVNKATVCLKEQIILEVSKLSRELIQN